MTAGRVLGSLGDSFLPEPWSADSSNSARSSACFSAFCKRAFSQLSSDAVSRRALSTWFNTASFLSVRPVAADLLSERKITPNRSANCSFLSIFSCKGRSGCGRALCKPSSRLGNCLHSSFSSMRLKALRIKGLRAGISVRRSMWTSWISSSPRVA